MDDAIVFTDRYAATGTPYPEPETVCRGDCEGMGCVPIQQDDHDPVYRALWKIAHASAHTIGAKIDRARREGIRTLLESNECDGWHFVPCPACGGTGKRPPETETEP